MLMSFDRLIWKMAVSLEAAFRLKHFACSYREYQYSDIRFVERELTHPQIKISSFNNELDCRNVSLERRRCTNDSTKACLANCFKSAPTSGFFASSSEFSLSEMRFVKFCDNGTNGTENLPFCERGRFEINAGLTGLKKSIKMMSLSMLLMW